jgi:hypothetical protein
MTRSNLEEVCLTEGMTVVRGSERSYLDTGELADRRSKMPMNMAIEMVTAVKSIPVDSVGRDTLGQMKIQENGKRKTGSGLPETACALGGWRSCMLRTVHQHTHKLLQLHRSITKMVNLVETQTALQEELW